MYSLLIIVLSCLVIATNIMVQVIKEVSSLKEKPTRLVTVVVGVLLTVASALAYADITNTTFTWYYLLASFFGGVLVSYGAMFGFDNLYGQFLDKVKEALTSKNK